MPPAKPPLITCKLPKIETSELLPAQHSMFQITSFFCLVTVSNHNLSYFLISYRSHHPISFFYYAHPTPLRQVRQSILRASKEDTDSILTNSKPSLNSITQKKFPVSFLTTTDPIYITTLQT